MNRQQIEWIFNHAERITNKYLNLFPLNDDLWQQLLEETKEIHRLSKENESVKEILFAVVDYFDKLDAVYRRESK